MDFGAEVSNKLKTSIKQKLQELQVYIGSDDDLPSYIMVMLANKRTRDQLLSDLQLFLDEKTALFVDWLLATVSKINNATSDAAPSTVSRNENQSSSSSKSHRKRSVSKRRDSRSSDSEGETRSRKKSKSRPKEEKPARMDPTTEVCASSCRRNRSNSPAQTSSGGKRVSSKITSRSRPTIDFGSSNANILKKAMNEASGAESKAPSSRKDAERSGSSKSRILSALSDDNERLDLDVNADADELDTLAAPAEVPLISSLPDNTRVQRTTIQVTLNGLDDRYLKKFELASQESPMDTSAAPSVHSRLTLPTGTGLAAPTVKPANGIPAHGAAISSALAASDQLVDPEEVDEDVAGAAAKEASDTVTLPKQKPERCRFWPSCRYEDSCGFLHPTVPCRNFPDCSFTADSCHFIHPDCKYDRSCRNPQCMFTHSTGVHPLKSAPLPAIQVPCRFYPNCTNSACPFVHAAPTTKNCRYGSACTRTNCMFQHPKVRRSDLKWVFSEREHVSERKFATPADDVTSMPVRIDT